ncbi:MAG: sugar transferase [Chitinophagaceae bacterium]|nr:MAG: sugar transferase [Chitinophagaceae bacterium]
MQQQLNVKGTLQIRVVGCIQSDETREVYHALSECTEFDDFPSLEELENSLMSDSLASMPEVLLLEVDENGDCFRLIEKIRTNPILQGLIVVLLAQYANEQWVTQAKKLRVHDFYIAPFPILDIHERLTFLVKFKLIKPTLKDLSKGPVGAYKVSPFKRAFDIVFAGMMLLCLMPLFLIVGLLIRLESRGPVIYKSKRVGTGYKVFDFYKFRSMYPDADKRLAELAAFNQYSGEGNQSAFIKLKNDPRITRVGRFIRKTSIDELPQLFNILKGDMSTVGNRPLPLYEAEMLTSNEWTWRFLAPAGLTGLWQISRRGREEMSERERKKLDNFYAKKHSMLFDMKILLRTLPAALQKSDV